MSRDLIIRTQHNDLSANYAALAVSHTDDMSLATCAAT